MKKLIAAAVLATAAIAGPALAGVGMSLDIGAPGFYGQIDIGGYHPRTLYDRPVLVQQRGYAALPPVYLRVPAGQDRNWRNYCGRYNACDRPVYFVRDDWYRNDYAPRYRNEHWRDGRYDRRDDRNDHRWDNRRDDHSNGRADHRDDRNDRQDHGRGEQRGNGGPNNGHDAGNGRRDDNNGRNSGGRRDDNNDGRNDGSRHQ